MKNIFIVIFTAIFVGVFALNINYQLKPVDKVWGLNDAVASGSNTSNTSGNFLVNFVSDVITDVVSYYNSKVYTCVKEDCDDAVYYTIVTPSTTVVGEMTTVAVAFETHYGPGKEWNCYSGTKYAHCSECTKSCMQVPSTSKT